MARQLARKLGRPFPPKLSEFFSSALAVHEPALGELRVTYSMSHHIRALAHSPLIRDGEGLCDFGRDLLAGLSARPKRLPPKYFYDGTGSQLFERITQLPEYYPTRTELSILGANARQIMGSVPKGAALIEFGSGASTKVRILLREAVELGAYVPVDISAAFLATEAARLRGEFPDLRVLPVAADFTRPFELPSGIRDCPRVGFFPGSTIGNFEPEEACGFLRLAARLLGSESTFIVGVDLEKDQGILEAAYSDAAGVTAEFNRNVLARANRELGANFNVTEFEHSAFYNPAMARIEMHLVSRRQQFVRVLGECFTFAEGETIHTESSYKYTAESFSALAHQGGWETTAILEDPSSLFALHVLRTGVG